MGARKLYYTSTFYSYKCPTCILFREVMVN